MNTPSNFQSSSTAPGIRRPVSAPPGIEPVAGPRVRESTVEPVVTELMTKALVDVPGKEVTMLTVSYPPGGADPVHRHNAHAFVYVLYGSIVMQMKGDKEVTLHPGETFYEDPSGIHLVGRNASDLVPAKFVVVLVKDKGAPALVPVVEWGSTAPVFPSSLYN
jgi:quercetin dioxygenase-like cupin family protein